MLRLTRLAPGITEPYCGAMSPRASVRGSFTGMCLRDGTTRGRSGTFTLPRDEDMVELAESPKPTGDRLLRCGTGWRCIDEQDASAVMSSQHPVVVLDRSPVLEQGW